MNDNKYTESEMPRILIGENPELDYVSVYFYSEEEPTGYGDFWHYDEDGNPLPWKESTVY